MFKRHLIALITASVLALTSIPALSQMGGGGMGGGGGMPASGSMPGGSWPGSGTGGSSGMRGMAGTGQSGGMSGARYERQMHAKALQRGHRDLLDFDPRGNLIVRNQVVGFGVTTQGLAAVQAVGFAVSRVDALKGLDANIVTLTVPPGMSGRRALRKLREIDPDTAFDFNHSTLRAAGEAESAATAPGASVVTGRRRPIIGLSMA
jgi:hypothetical protein